MQTQNNSIFDFGAVWQDVRKLTDGAGFISHGMDHLDRVARGASYFASMENFDRVAMDTAYIAGLIHDLNRPKSESKDHAKSSEESARDFLRRFNCYGHEDEILELVANHRQSNSRNISSVYTADKILEQMGAYLAFRGSIYIAEVDDFSGIDGLDLAESYVNMTRCRMDKFSAETFPQRLGKIHKYQMDWVNRFLDSLGKKDKWAIDLAFHCYERARSGETMQTTEKIIDEYEPTDLKNAEYKTEASRYLAMSPQAFCSEFIRSV